MSASLATLIGTAQIFTLVFVMLGPLKILGPFVKATQGADGTLLRRIALTAFALSTASLFAAMYIGENTLSKWRVSLPALTITAGALLFFVAFRSLINLYDEVRPPAVSGGPVAPSLATAISPLTFPVIATPYGIAILILLKTALPASTAALVEILGGMMVLNLLAMLFARPIVRVAGLPLQLIGTILTVLQAALGVQFLILGIRTVANGN